MSSESIEKTEGIEDEDDKCRYPYMEQSADKNEKKRQLPLTVRLERIVPATVNYPAWKRTNPAEAYCLHLWHQKLKCSIKWNST